MLGLSNILLYLKKSLSLKRERGRESVCHNPTMKWWLEFCLGDGAISFADKKKKGMHFSCTIITSNHAQTLGLFQNRPQNYSFSLLHLLNEIQQIDIKYIYTILSIKLIYMTSPINLRLEFLFSFFNNMCKKIKQ